MAAVAVAAAAISITDGDFHLDPVVPELYVAVSRVPESENIMLFCRDSQVMEQLGGVLLTNIVYPSLLLSAEDFS